MHKGRNESEIKTNPQGTNSEGNKARVQINNLEHKEGINSQPVHKEEQEFKKKKRERIRRLWDISKCTNIQIMGMPGEEEEQEIKNLVEKIMKENFPNLAKELETQGQEAQRVHNKLDPKRTTPGHIIIKMPNIKDKESFFSISFFFKEI